MSSQADIPNLTPRQLADLSALADGSLDPARREEVQARISASPELQVLYDEERRAVSALHQARAEDRAPVSLRARIEAERPGRARRTTVRVRYGGALAVGLAALALALVLILPAGSPGSPSISQAAALAARSPSQAAPAPDPAAPLRQLNLNTRDVYFPNWEPAFGWVAYGSRDDKIAGRDAKTVYYRNAQAQWIAYTIVAAPPLGAPRGSVTWLNGTKLKTLSLNGRTVVTWHRAGDTCVLSGPGVSVNTLHQLAAWKVELPAGAAS
jgi:hypothetical protein